MYATRGGARAAHIHVEQIHAHEDDDEAAQERHGRRGAVRVEASEEQKRRKDRRGGEHDVVDGVDDVCAELVQGLVEVVHLHQDAHHDDDGKAVRRRVRELVVAVKGELERDAEALDGHDRDGPDERADGEIDERRALAVARDHAPDHPDGEPQHKQAVGEKGRLEGVVENLVDRLDLLVLGGVDDDDDRADETERTPDAAQPTQLLLEDEARQDGADEHTQCAEGRDENGRGKRVCGKVGHLADDHGEHAGEPDGVGQVRVAVGCVCEATAVCGVHEAALGDDKRRADGERRPDGEGEADELLCAHVGDAGEVDG